MARGRNGIDEYDFKKVVEMLTQAKGERSFREYAIDAKVSPANLYRIRKGDYKPSPQMLKTLTSENAAPRGNITFEDLMIAAGYQDKNSLEIARQDMIESEYESQRENKSIRDLEESDEEREERMRRREERLAKRRAFQMASVGMIYTSLAKKGIEFKQADAAQIEVEVDRRIRPDIIISVDQDKTKEWWFEVAYIEPSRLGNNEGIRRGRFYFERYKHLVFAKLMFMEPDEKRKISIVVNNEDFYEELAKYQNKTAYRGELSVIFIDPDDFTRIEETYISHYDVEGIDREFYIH